MSKNLQYKKLISLDGKAAIWARGFFEFLHDNDLQAQEEGLVMRKAQEAGVASTLELGEEISIAYVSKLTVLFQEAGVIYKERRGKKYMIFPAPGYWDYHTFLDRSTYGQSMTKELPIEQVRARSQFLDSMKSEGAVRISKDHPLAKAAYQVAIDKFKSGQYDMVFVEADKLISILPTDWDIEDAIVIHGTESSVAG